MQKINMKNALQLPLSFDPFVLLSHQCITALISACRYDVDVVVYSVVQ